jgi:YtcA family
VNGPLLNSRLTVPSGPQVQRRQVSGWRLGVRRLASPALAIQTLFLAGCRPGPSVDLLGSFFPAWMLALVIGIVLTLLLRQLFIWTDLDPYLAPRGLVYVALAVLVTLATWLFVFRG